MSTTTTKCGISSCENMCDTFIRDPNDSNKIYTFCCAKCFNEVVCDWPIAMNNKDLCLYRMTRADKEEQLNKDLEYIRYICDFDGFFPFDDLLRGDKTMFVLFHGIQNRDLSKYMEIFRESVQRTHETMRRLGMESKNQQEERNMLKTTVKTREEYQKYTINMLKAEMNRLQIYDTTGRKADLIDRIMNY